MNAQDAFRRDTRDRYLAAAALKSKDAEQHPDPTERWLAASSAAWYIKEAERIINYLSWRT